MNCAVILAGGQGSRYKKQKQFELLDGKEMWKHVYDKALKIVEKKDIVVVGVDVEGGKTRSESVSIGLNRLDGDYNKVIILEAARPLVTVEQMKTLLGTEYKSNTFVMPLVNTVIGRDGTYYNRKNFYDLLTPQAFDFKLLKAAYNTQKYSDTTDETVVMYNEYGIKPHFIEDGENLIKVTYRRDMEIIKQLMAKEEEL